MAEPRRPASRGGPKGRPPPGPPPAINHFPFPSARGERGGSALRGSGMSVSLREERGVVRGSGAVWCWPTAKFLHRKPLRREPHTPQITIPCIRARDSLLQSVLSTEAAHCPQCEGHARARALLVLNPAGSTSSARSGFGLLGGRCLDPAHASAERCKHGQEQRAVRASAGEGSPAPPSPSQTKVRRRECTL